MITWQQLANFLPLAAVLISTGMMLERISALRAAVKELRSALHASAESQGRRIGNLESYLGLNADGIPVERIGGLTGRHRLPGGDDDGE